MSLTFKQTAPNDIEVLRGPSMLGHIIELRGEYFITWYNRKGVRVDDPTFYPTVVDAMQAISIRVATTDELEEMTKLAEGMTAPPPGPRLVWTNPNR